MAPSAHHHHMPEDVAKVEQRLQLAGIDDPRGQAMTLIALALEQHQQSPNTPWQTILEQIVHARETHKSIARIMGYKKFNGLTIKLADGVYEPCNSSERLVDHAVDWAQTHLGNTPIHILDMGTGTGNLLFAALQELPTARGTGIDCNPAAIELATRNAHELGFAERCTFMLGNGVEGIHEQFDILISVMPFVPTQSMKDLLPEVILHEPIEALDGGRDGLKHFRSFAQVLAHTLAPRGSAFFQLGYEFVPFVKSLFERAGHRDFDVLKDGYGFPIGLRIGNKA